MEDALCAASDRATTGPTLSRSLGRDTAFVCLFALILVRLGTNISRTGARLLSPAHPAGRATESAVDAWRERVDAMPWGGFVPTDAAISPTQTAWVIAFLFGMQLVLHILDLPHLPLPHTLRHHLPHISLRIVSN